MKNLQEKIQKMPKYVWILLAVVLVGIFLRTYHFHDWLRFNADQSRDAGVVSDFVEGKTSLPLLGPKAGGTNFRLGPVFYYFQIASAKVFGDYPDKMAYPDLVSSILAIPLMFLFLRKYFDDKISLAATAIFAVSFFAIKYSRFAWNPNSLPFWSTLFLYVLHSFATLKEKNGKKWLLIVIAGIAMGVGVQLHTLALVFFPIMLIGVFGYLLIQKKKVWLPFFAIIFMAAILNAGQIYSEFKTGGENVKSFLGGIGTKEKKGSGILNNIEKNAVCFAQANTYILSSYNASDTCELKAAFKGYDAIILLFAVIFLVGGYVLALKYFKKEQDLGRKYFLGIFIFYLSISFLVLIPLANEISMRFFLVIVFMPLVLLGMWIKFLSEKFHRNGIVVSLVIVCLFVLGNIFAVRQSFVESGSYTRQSDAGMDNVTLKEVELAADYIAAHSGSSDVAYVDGDAKYLFKALKSIEYLTQRKGISLDQVNKKNDSSSPAFLIDNTSKKDSILKNNIGISDYESLGRFTIFKLR